jgi:hypothetical protein
MIMEYQIFLVVSTRLMGRICSSVGSRGTLDIGTIHRSFHKGGVERDVHSSRSELNRDSRLSGERREIIA